MTQLLAAVFLLSTKFGQGEDCLSTSSPGAVAVSDALEHPDGSLQLLQARGRDGRRAPAGNLSFPGDRLLATGRHEKAMVLADGLELYFLSAVPVFSPNGEEAYIALIHEGRREVRLGMANRTLFCRQPGGEAKAMTMFNKGVMPVEGMQDVEIIIVWHCPWAAEDRDRTCHDVVLTESDDPVAPVVGLVQACQNQSLSEVTQNYEMAACVRNLWTLSDPTHLYESGILMLPQWLEYNLMHGVDHFFFYTVTGTTPIMMEVIKPYILAGLGTHIHLELPVPFMELEKINFLRWHQVQFWIANDCLYRAKHRARWLMPTMDVDEYLRPTDGQDVLKFSMPALADNLSASLSPTNASAAFVDLTRVVFRYAMDPLQQLEVSSPHKASPEGGDYESTVVRPGVKDLPKYLIRPEASNHLFVHWPLDWASGTAAKSTPIDCAVVHHYRTANAADTVILDDTLAGHADLIFRRLEDRFRSPWPEVAAKLLASGGV